MYKEEVYVSMLKCLELYFLLIFNTPWVFWTRTRMFKLLSNDGILTNKNHITSIQAINSTLLPSLPYICVGTHFKAAITRIAVKF